MFQCLQLTSVLSSSECGSGANSGDNAAEVHLQELPVCEHGCKHLWNCRHKLVQPGCGYVWNGRLLAGRCRVLCVASSAGTEYMAVFQVHSSAPGRFQSLIR
jgi:hypothetical protein